MAHQQQDLRWFDFVLRVHNVLIFGGLALGAAWALYAAGGQWVSDAVMKAPDWIVLSDLYAMELLLTVAKFIWFNWFIAIPAIYAVAILITRKLWY